MRQLKSSRITSIRRRHLKGHSPRRTNCKHWIAIKTVNEICAYLIYDRWVDIDSSEQFCRLRIESNRKTKKVSLILIYQATWYFGNCQFLTWSKFADSFWHATHFQINPNAYLSTSKLPVMCLQISKLRNATENLCRISEDQRK